jgi:hypothetical protein
MFETFNIKIGGRTETVTVGRLKPHLGTPAPEVSITSKRGRSPLAPVIEPCLYTEVKSGHREPEKCSTGS